MFKYQSLIVFIILILILSPITSAANYHTLDKLSVSVRADTTYGHAVGISYVISGITSPSTNLQISLIRSGSNLITKKIISDSYGNFGISMDYLILDGDQIQIISGSTERIIQVPILTYKVDASTHIITGKAPADITNTIPGSPSSLQISFGTISQMITTDTEGNYSANFLELPFLAARIGSMKYTNSQGDKIFKPIAAIDPLHRGEMDDWSADIILGQPDFSQITPNQVVGNRLFNPGGVYIDRYSQPNRLYIYDSGNSRILGFEHLGFCDSGEKFNQKCTTDSDCPGSVCQIDSNRSADIIIGQLDSQSSKCNGDNGYLNFPDDAAANSVFLCGMRALTSVNEAGSMANLAIDSNGNLYVPDFFNNRILRFDDPFVTDTIADYVWGQVDFSGTFCNQLDLHRLPNNERLCLAPPPFSGDIKAGVGIDSQDNLWVADNMNNRVLRFPYDPEREAPAVQADLVLGQPDFFSNLEGRGLNQMQKPTAVRVDSTGKVFVADSRNGRVLVFYPPYSNGMHAATIYTDGMIHPTGLELDNNDNLWVNDNDTQRILKYTSDILAKTVENMPPFSWGGIGIDNDGNLFITSWVWGQEVYRYRAPNFDVDLILLPVDVMGNMNQTGPRGLDAGTGLEIAGSQLVVADGSRLVFWNNIWGLSDYQSADGVIGDPNFYTREPGPHFSRMRVDPRHPLLWVIRGSQLLAYPLPLQSGSEPVITLNSPLPLLGGGQFEWIWTLVLSGIDFQPNCDCLWLSDSDNNRAFRIRNPSSPNPFVDIVLGQKDISGVHCNMGRDSDDGYTQPTSPSQDSLCHPGALSFDKQGNLFLSDNNLEIAGNNRLLIYEAHTLPDEPSSAVFGIPATHVLGRNNDFTSPSCVPFDVDPLCGSFEVAFNSIGQAVIGFNGYLGSNFPLIYDNILSKPLPNASLADFYGMPFSLRFDEFDNLYIIDHNRNHILIYLRNEIIYYTNFLPIVYHSFMSKHP